MKKGLTFLLLVLMATLAASLFGALHNQLSYTVSPEYFTRFKFEQFRIEPGFGNRMGAAVVGVAATWWFGLMLGLVLALVALFQPTAKALLRNGLRAIGWAILVTVLFSLLGLFLGHWVLGESTLNWQRFPDVVDRKAFVAAGSMHNFSYSGGTAGLLVGCFYLFRKRSRNR